MHLTKLWIIDFRNEVQLDLTRCECCMNWGSATNTNFWRNGENPSALDRFGGVG